MTALTTLTNSAAVTTAAPLTTAPATTAPIPKLTAYENLNAKEVEAQSKSVSALESPAMSRITLPANSKIDFNLLTPNNPLLPKLMAMLELISSPSEVVEAAKTNKLKAKVKLANEAAEKECATAAKDGKIKEVAAQLLGLKGNEVDFESLMCQRAKILNQYAEMIRRYDRYDTDSSGAMTIPGKPNEKVPLTFGELLTAIYEISYKHLTGDEKLATQGVEVRDGSTIKFRAKLEDGKINIITVGEAIGVEKEGDGGDGHTSMVYKVWEVASEQFMALKVAKTTEKGFRTALLNEAATLRRIHTGGLKPGIQPPMSAVFDIVSTPQDNVDEKDRKSVSSEDEEGERFTACLGPFYKGGQIFHWIQGELGNGPSKKPNVSPAQRVDWCRQLLTAYKIKEDLGIWNGDVKPENVLVDETGNKVVMADWGGTITYVEAGNSAKIPITRTDHYLNFADETELHALRLKVLQFKRKRVNPNEIVDPTEVEQNKTALIQVAKRTDFYSLSLMLYTILNIYPPYECIRYIESNGLEWVDNLAVPYQETESLKHYDKKIVDQIIRMVSHNPAQRGTLEEALKVFGVNS